MAKTKTLISFAVTAKLICVFVFAYAKIRFSHDEALLQFQVYGGYFGFMTVLFVLVAVVSIVRQGRSKSESLKLSNLQNMDTEKQANELER